MAKPDGSGTDVRSLIRPTDSEAEQMEDDSNRAYDTIHEQLREAVMEPAQEIDKMEPDAEMTDETKLTEPGNPRETSQSVDAKTQPGSGSNQAPIR